MNILIVNYEYPPLGGGGGVATKELAEQLARHHTVHVITSAFRGLPGQEVVKGVSIRRVPVLGRTKLPTATLVSMLTFVPSAFFVGLRLCAAERFDVVNGQFALPSGLPAALLARLFRLPFVLSLIGGDLYDPSKGVSPHRHGALRGIIRMLARQASAITAISTDTERRARELHGVIQPITVIPIGLVPPHVPPADRAKLEVPSGFVAISIGRLIPRKGYTTLLKVWRDIQDAHLLIVGSGPLKSKLQKMIRAQNLEDRVHILSDVSDERKHQLLEASDLYISTATHEGFGIVFLEAMHAGLPIVAPREGGQTDFLQAGVNAILVDSRQASAVKEAVQRLRRNQSLRQTMATANRQRVAEFYIDKTAGMFESLLEKAVRDYENRY